MKVPMPAHNQPSPSESPVTPPAPRAGEPLRTWKRDLWLAVAIFLYFERRGDDLYATINITPIEAMIGCKKTVTNITGSTMDLDIRPGVESGVEFASGGNGFTNVNNGHRGRFVSVVKIKTPAITDPVLVSKLKDLNAQISQ